MSRFHTIELKSSKRCEMIDITASVREIVRASSTSDGLCIVYIPHTTAGVTINESADPDVQKDIAGHMSKLVPQSNQFLHCEGNSDSHIKALLTTNSVQIIVSENNLILGTWQAVFFCEFDGPRQRKVYVKIING